jgi:hypothetical protein
MEQQIANQQGTISELRIGLEQSLDRANIVKIKINLYFFKINF